MGRTKRESTAATLALSGRLGDLVDQWKYDNKKTQEELAKNIKASKSSIEKYEYGTVNYTFETLLKIADKYNLNIIIETKK